MCVGNHKKKKKRKKNQREATINKVSCQHTYAPSSAIFESDRVGGGPPRDKARIRASFGNKNRDTDCSTTGGWFLCIDSERTKEEIKRLLSRPIYRLVDFRA